MWITKRQRNETEKITVPGCEPDKCRLSDTCATDFVPPCHKNQRDRVLDELESKLNERKRELLEQYETGERSMLVWERRIGILEALDEITELRQGDRE